METLKNIYKEYYKLRMNYCNSMESAEGAVNKVLGNKTPNPHIYTDNGGFATYIVYCEHVLFFDTGIIYKMVN